LHALVGLALALVFAPAGGVPVRDGAGRSDSTRARIGFDDGPSAIFQARCVSCHGAADSNGGLRLDSYAATLRGGESGPSVVPGAPTASLLHLKITGRDQPSMPPRVSLRRSEIRVITDWIAAGAAP
jgi:hypothetical protein